MKKINKKVVISIILIAILIMVAGVCFYRAKINTDEQNKGEHINAQSEEEFIGEEDVDDSQKSNEEIALEIAEKEWGDKDQSVTFSIEQNDGTIYHIAVKKDATVITWYEINAVERTINEYF